MTESTVKLNKEIFNLSVENYELLKLSYDAYLDRKSVV